MNLFYDINEKLVWLPCSFLVGQLTLCIFNLTID